MKPGAGQADATLEKEHAMGVLGWVVLGLAAGAVAGGPAVR
jgi:hypothetical protein